MFDLMSNQVELEADLLVLGAGMAGLTAAARACADGARVVLVEKAPSAGGTALYAGYVWTAASYEAIGERIKATGAQSVYLAGIVCNNGVKLIKDIGAVLGKGVTLAAPDGFTPYSATAGAGAAAQGMYISYAGVPLSLLGKAGKAFLKGFAKYQGRKVVDPYAVYAAQDAQILLNAIKNSNGTRLSVVKNVFKTRVKDGIMGTFRFDAKGDICPFKTISFDRLVGTSGKFYSYVRVKASC